MSDYINIHIHNYTGQPIYLAVKSNDVGKANRWAHLQRDESLHWGHLHHRHFNLRIDEPLLKIGYPNNIGGEAIMYFSTRPLKQAPDFESTLFIYDQIEITNRNKVKRKDGTEEHFLAKCQLSHVNFFGMPIRMEATAGKVGFGDEISRHKILSDLVLIDTPFDTYKISRTYPNAYRHFSPAWKDPSNIWQEAIRGGLAAISNKTVDFDGPGIGEKTRIKFGDATENSIFVTETNLDTSDNPIIIREFTVSNINTFKALRGTLFPEDVKAIFSKIIAPDEADDQLNQTIKSGALLSAALHRGVLYDPTLWGPVPSSRAENYYQASDENCGQYNEYSKVLHKHALNGKCFGFCYDNFYSQGKSLKVTGNTDYDKNAQADLKIILLPFEA